MIVFKYWEGEGIDIYTIKSNATIMMDGYDTLGALITQIFKHTHIKGVSKTAIHKILFKLKRELPENNMIKEELPFYWYNYGPFSEVINTKIIEFKKSGVLGEHVTSTEKTVCVLEREITHHREDDDFLEAVSLLRNILKTVNPYNFKPFIDEIYRHNAPSRFIPLLKLDFIEQLEKYIEQIPSPQTTLDVFNETYGKTFNELDSLEEVLYECEGNLPSDPLFESFNTSFSSFVTTASRIFDYMKNGGDPIFLEQLGSIATEKVWYTFTKGARMLYHDSYYDEYVPQWKENYDKYLYFYKRDVESLNTDALRGITPERLFTPMHTERSKNILSSAIDGYLS